MAREIESLDIFIDALFFKAEIFSRARYFRLNLEDPYWKCVAGVLANGNTVWLLLLRGLVCLFLYRSEQEKKKKRQCVCLTS